MKEKATPQDSNNTFKRFGTMTTHIIPAQYFFLQRKSHQKIKKINTARQIIIYRRPHKQQIE